MASDFLAKVVEYKRGLLREKKAYFDSLKKKSAGEKITRYHLFKKAIARPGQINLIAEIKKASPSQGVIVKRFDVIRFARVYEKHGAAALSILTEDKFFLGKPAYIRKAADEVNLPVLTKDFIIDEVQVYETFYQGSSAILLIAAILNDEELKKLYAAAHRLGLDCLVEIHDETELDRALAAGAEIIGINHRDLRTLEVDLGLSEKLIPRIPRDKIIVAESGIKTHDDIVRLKSLGAHAVLIGETFLRAADAGKKIDEVMNGPG